MKMGKTHKWLDLEKAGFLCNFNIYEEILHHILFYAKWFEKPMHFSAKEAAGLVILVLAADLQDHLCNKTTLVWLIKELEQMDKELQKIPSLCSYFEEDKNMEVPVRKALNKLRERLLLFP